ncbi:hypothetical protein B7494_g3560 [Chlorociboria aeruginascens]|nr:hypothetical protein B7494_g3560 [Chlorociboria aeruginascens]
MSKTTATTTTTGLPRIACFHGGGSNASIFRVQSARLQSLLSSHFEFIYFEGPFASGPGPDVLPVFADYAPYKLWFRSAGDLTGGDGLERVQDLMREMGGQWVGAMGFSQGTRVVAGLLLEQQRRRARGEGDEDEDGGLRFGVLCNGSGRPMLAEVPSDDHVPVVTPLLDAPVGEVIEILTLHVHGLRDRVLELGRIQLKEHFKPGTATLYEIDYHHAMPWVTAELQGLADRIVEIYQNSYYFSTTYQTYVRALYARLRSPAQFIYLQVLSSSFLIVLAPLTISSPFHSLLTLLSLSTQTYPAYRKFCARNIFIRSIAENVSMLTFLSSILVLHYGNNKNVYPYFAFDYPTNSTASSIPADHSKTGLIGGGEAYDFNLTVWASVVTWACEIVAGWIVRRILWLGWKTNVTGEAKSDLGMWPELLPTGVVVMLHVLQNMLFSIVRLKFH